MRHGSVSVKTRSAVHKKAEFLCGLMDCSEQERNTVLNCLASVILSKYTNVTNQC